MATAILTLGMGLVGAFLGSYLAGYLKEKGKNLATREDIEKLVDQVSAVTKATKEIEAKISGELWNRQKRWEMKRDVLFAAAKAIAEVDEALLKYKSLFDVTANTESPAWIEAHYESVKMWSEASAALDAARLFVAIVCSRETEQAFDKFKVLANNIAAGISKRDRDIYNASQQEFVKKLFAVRIAIQRELEVEIRN